MSQHATYESVFQADIVTQMQAQGWKLGSPSGYQAEISFYKKDVFDFRQNRRQGCQTSSCYSRIVYP